MKIVQKTETRKKGFTLIELSIVLVIIGLIVGGVLVGQDLIKAAEVRATVSQVEKYNSAINTFRSKYNGLPGDLLGTSATAFGLFSTGMTGAQGLGDGNGLLQDSTGGMLGKGETLAFWRHLSDTNLIDGSYGADLVTGGVANVTTPATYLPAAKLGRGNYFGVASTSGFNYYFLSGVTSVTTSSGQYVFAKQLTPIEAYNMDIKMDDGAPETGVIQAHGLSTSTTAFLTDVTAFSSATAPASGDCVTTGTSGSDTADTYNRAASTGGNTPACILRFRFN